MIAIDFYKDRPVGVLGLGRTGCAVIEALVAGGADVIAWDDAKASRQRKNFGKRFKLCAPDHSDWCGIDLLVPSPGILERHDLIERLRPFENSDSPAMLSFLAARCCGFRLG